MSSASQAGMSVTTQPKQHYSMSPHGYPPKSFMRLSIMTAFCFCVPIGLLALYFSSQVNSRWNNGDAEGAKRASKQALLWNVVGIITGIVLSAALIATIVVLRIIYYSS